MGSGDIVLAKYDPSGNYVWGKRLGTPQHERVDQLAIDSSGNVIIAGTFQGTLNLGGSALVSAGVNDIFVAKFDSTGAHLWSRRFGGDQSDDARMMQLDASDNIYLAGAYSGAPNFGGGPLPELSWGIYVAKLGPTGLHQWSEGMGSNDPAGVISGARDAGTGEITLAVTFQGTLDLGGCVMEASPKQATIALARLDGNGGHLWSRRYVGPNEAALAADGAGSFFLSGSYYDSMNFGLGPLTSIGGGDIFIARICGAGC